jgi:hypothetical protein
VFRRRRVGDGKNRQRQRCGPQWDWAGRFLGEVGLLGWLLCGAAVNAAELSVAGLKIRPDSNGLVVVSGAIDNESTYGVTVMLEITPRPGSTGNVEFTPVLVEKLAERGSFSIHRKTGRLDEVRVATQAQPSVDIVQLGDPWPDQGTFSAYDTDLSESRRLNGIVDDNGTFVRAPIKFAGSLAAFPIVASADADGIWDVSLSIPAGDSSWVGITTNLTGGTITVAADACVTDRDCYDGDPCTADTCDSGTCEHTQRQRPCNGREPVKRAKPRTSPSTGVGEGK